MLNNSMHFRKGTTENQRWMLLIKIIASKRPVRGYFDACKFIENAQKAHEKRKERKAMAKCKKHAKKDCMKCAGKVY